MQLIQFENNLPAEGAAAMDAVLIASKGIFEFKDMAAYFQQ